MTEISTQLSTYELLLLFYHVLSLHANDHFRELIEKYQLFRYLPFRELIDRKNRDKYNSSAFED